ncbi:MAG: hypothetical protein KDK23_14545 [Leptospiraceae bacterium]|nr:hypothetical protein [Leptospiraceae bacterium]
MQNSKPGIHKLLVLSFILAFPLSKCLQLEKSPAGNLPALLALASSREAFFLFPDQSSASTSSNGMILARPDAGAKTVDLHWIPFNGGPENTRLAAIHNGVVFISQPDGEDELWISGNGGQGWRVFEAPEDNEDEDFAYLLSCGSAVIVAYDTVSLSEEDGHPGYVSYDGGQTFQKWSAIGSEEISIDGMDCNEEYLFIASNDQNHLQWAPVENLNSFTTASAHSSIIDTYEGLVAGPSAILGIAEQNGDHFSNFASGLPDDMNYSGPYPVTYNYQPGGTGRGADYIDDNNFVAMLDTFNGICRVYSMDAAGEDPASASYAQPACNKAPEPSIIPALGGNSSSILFSYAGSDGLEGGVMISFDEGASFSNVPVTSVWSDSGSISDIEQGRVPGMP